ncbi:MAG: MBL fold metallo-hydrolase [Gemmatimonadota bacterium]|nr:MBL fold metallo-hydrolase [Gemmatimonadota bacterium]
MSSAPDAEIPGRAVPPHHAPNGTFRNPWGLSESRFGGLLKWRWNRLRHPLPPDTGGAALRPHAPSIRTPHAAANEIAITWVGHSTLIVQLGSLNLLVDPVWGERASPWRSIGPRRLVPAAVAMTDMPPIDIVLLSHNHYDHLDAYTVRALAHTHPEAHWAVPLRLATLVHSLGIRHVTELDWWSDARIGDATVACTPARHFSARTPLDRNRTLWCGFAVSGPGGRFFYAGDTGNHPEFAEIGRRYGPFDVCALPIGAYEPRWFMHPVHLDPDDAVAAYRAVHEHHGLCRRAAFVAVHWGTFRLTDEPILEPPRRTKEAWEREGLAPDNLWIMAHGETRVITK